MTVGKNGSFTLLVLSDNALLTQFGKVLCGPLVSLGRDRRFVQQGGVTAPRLERRQPTFSEPTTQTQQATKKEPMK